jgi:hypothetical protein
MHATSPPTEAVLWLGSAMNRLVSVGVAGLYAGRRTLQGQLAGTA